MLAARECILCRTKWPPFKLNSMLDYIELDTPEEWTHRAARPKLMILRFGKGLTPRKAPVAVLAALNGRDGSSWLQHKCSDRSMFLSCSCLMACGLFVSLRGARPQPILCKCQANINSNIPVCLLNSAFKVGVFSLKRLTKL